MRVLGIVLALGGLLVLVGYGIYYAFRGFFADPSIPLAVRVAVPALIVGVILLLVSVGWERFRRGKEEHLEGVEK